MLRRTKIKLRLCTPIYTYSPIHWHDHKQFWRFHQIPRPPYCSGGDDAMWTHAQLFFCIQWYKLLSSIHLFLGITDEIARINPKIWEEIISGNLSVKRTAGTFSVLPPDHVIEQTINKKRKGAGGIIGINTSAVSVQRWILSSHVTAKIFGDLRESINLA